MLLTVFCSLNLMVLTVWFHATGLGFLRRNVLSHSVSHHLSLAAIVSTALVLHLIEICAYAGVIWVTATPHLIGVTVTPHLIDSHRTPYGNSDTPLN